LGSDNARRTPGVNKETWFNVIKKNKRRFIQTLTQYLQARNLRGTDINFG